MKGVKEIATRAFVLQILRFSSNDTGFKFLGSGDLLLWEKGSAAKKSELELKTFRNKMTHYNQLCTISHKLNSVMGRQP